MGMIEGGALGLVDGVFSCSHTSIFNATGALIGSAQTDLGCKHVLLLLIGPTAVGQDMISFHLRVLTDLRLHREWFCRGAQPAPSPLLFGCV